MRELTRSALTPYSPEQMFALVEDIERYPEFLPWVDKAELIERRDSEVIGRLSMHRAGLHEKFTTRNVLNPPREIVLNLVSGPFRTLEGRWTFENIADRGTRVSLCVRFEFANSVLALLLTRSFEKNCTDLINAFVARARKLYGAS
jgi:ribosome-associated toxin RatA of RatAB toxin-antitoxin module